MLVSLRTSLRLLGREASRFLVTSNLEKRSLNLCANAISSSSNSGYDFKTLKVETPADFVKHVEINRPNKRNAMNANFWREMVECFNQLAKDEDCRVVILSGAGKVFTAGLDLTDGEIFQSLVMSETDCSRKAFKMAKSIPKFQDSFTAIENCPKPVIAAVHSACIGGGIDMISACDIRYCTQDAWFQIKEVDLGLAADVGTLQRFPKIVGNDSLTRELTYTARKFSSEEAESIGFVSRILKDKDQMMKQALGMATNIASKSPVAVQGSKVNLVYSRDHSVSEGLDYNAKWNMVMLQSEDVMKAASATLNKTKAVFSKL
ncbi:delta(3,5)-Delta(2,4)-dienoyl-CoA isomerase, mitochondrial-like [Elysia marginata]|uniref:Delta(3,5)-Delta(2,4)-dienoyl-CoA isomerase, mitochondrial n=1 Tax=Elysia marginata TaxID=1093978 RepID=A0AAV4GND5_9GAST|nr:delta(3,5)-Delta(2,4)-dienoyl-CoA isomerase, mitochondrial-like [Elysia marginata]